MLAIMRSSIQVRFGYFPMLEIHGVSKFNEDGRRTNFLFPASAVLSILGGTPTVSLTGAALAPPPAPDIDAALHNPRVAKALRILGSRQPTWHNLYNVFEIVQSDVGGKIIKAGWATKAEVE